MVGHAGDFLKDPFQVFIRIVSEDAAVFDECVDDGAAPAGVFASDEEPVFCSELERTHGVLGAVVVE